MLRDRPYCVNKFNTLRRVNYAKKNVVFSAVVLIPKNRPKKRNRSFGKRNLYYQRWYCNDCKRDFKPNQDHPINFSIKIRACHHNLSFIWLTSGLKPDHKTNAEFRRRNRSALAKVLKQCAKICIKLTPIEGNALFIDGTKIRANASIHNTD